MKKIIALSCGTKGGECETFIRAAAAGAKELGVETEIIQAMDLKVLPFPAKDDDVGWILEKTCLEDCGLIVAVPCYHARANGLFYDISDKVNPLFGKNKELHKKTKVGAIIGVGGSGYDGWANLVLLSVNIFIQHNRKLVDQIQVNHCAFPEWNLWLQQGSALTSNTQEFRVEDVPYEKPWEAWNHKFDLLSFRQKALLRAEELGRNVARAMDMPIEKVKYVGEEAGMACPVCHCNLLLVPENLPYIYCPCCGIRGTVATAGGKMSVKWNMEDAKTPRYGYETEIHHADWIKRQGHEQFIILEKVKEMKSKYSSYGTIIKPPVKS